jgi:hypothetical protein
MTEVVVMPMVLLYVASMTVAHVYVTPMLKLGLRRWGDSCAVERSITSHNQKSISRNLAIGWSLVQNTVGIECDER